ncbi:hypothetical protein HAALTHF_26380n [Vreelandella aquamarina]|nr:hypothetical protein HAALTHF_26380n [Halomonas axialensis]
MVPTARRGVSEDDEALIEQRTREKIELYRQHGLKIAEFGTRRRFSFAVHDRVVKALRHYGGEAFSGTSNVLLAMRHGVKPIGTHAHEWFMFHGARFGFKMANSLALEHWVDVYRGDLGIALTDTFTTRAFSRASIRSSPSSSTACATIAATRLNLPMPPLPTTSAWALTR